MIEIKNRNGETIVTVADSLFPLRFKAFTVSGEKQYRINITYCPDIDPMRASEKIKGFHLTLDNDDLKT